LDAIGFPQVAREWRLNLGTNARNCCGGALSDYLEDAALEYWSFIRLMYERFADKKPVMLLDIQEERVYAYPYIEFMKELSERSQRTLKKQYEDANRDGQVVVFVRDNDKRRLISFSFDL
jgi:hypothetical protein